ncbi:helix-turn-helix domain-containing protein [Pseudalkalibacillus sp. Hm43]|uniref:helix-turn-helix domain-containing protein n=1 Tax=Pseudalkalibacillus sp. Hm43 TaxID=3450742 RepID=UPI003F4316D9
MVIAEMVDDLSTTFKALSHPIRRQILDALINGPMSTGDLNERFPDVTRYAVMKHLGMLESANLITIRRVGRVRLNYLNAVPLREMYNRWVNKYEDQDAHSLLSLKEKAEQSVGRHEEMENGLKQDSFQIEQEITINATRDKVFKALTEDINDWWAYRLNGDQGSTLSFEPKVGGQFLESWGDGEGALWGVVTYIKAPEEIRMNGLLGMRGAVNSAYTYSLEEKGDQTVLKLSHHAYGLLDPQWRDAHDGGWQELLGQFLKEYVESGKRPEKG